MLEVTNRQTTLTLNAKKKKEFGYSCTSCFLLGFFLLVLISSGSRFRTRSASTRCEAISFLFSMTPFVLFFSLHSSFFLSLSLGSKSTLHLSNHFFFYCTYVPHTHTHTHTHTLFGESARLIKTKAFCAVVRAHPPLASFSCLFLPSFVLVEICIFPRSFKGTAL